MLEESSIQRLRLPLRLIGGCAIVPMTFSPLSTLLHASPLFLLCLGLGRCSYSWLLQSDAPCQHAFLVLIACVNASKP